MSAPARPAPALPAELLGWIESTMTGKVTNAARVPGGGRRQAWYIDVRRDDRVDELFLRYDPKRPGDPADPFTLHREAQFYRALADSDVPVPRVYGVHPKHQAILSSRTPGVAAFSRVTDERVRLTIARDFMRCLANLHRVDPKVLMLPAEPLLEDLRALVHREIDVWERLYRTHGKPDALAEFGFRYLREHVPDVGGPIVIVQGDTGPGNFLYRGDAVTAVLDWELGHYGDPMEDLGWLSLRAAQDPFTDLADRIVDYAKQVDFPVDYGRIRYYRVFAELRVVVLGLQRAEHHDLMGEVAGGLIFGALHRRLCIEALADVLDVALDEVPRLDASVHPHDWLYEATLVQIQDIIVPGSTDPFVAARSKGMARVVKYLREVDQRGAALEQAERDDLSRLLGREVMDVAAARSELAQLARADQLERTATLRYLGRVSARETQLLAASMGSLAERHLDPLPRVPAARRGRIGS